MKRPIQLCATLTVIAALAACGGGGGSAGATGSNGSGTDTGTSTTPTPVVPTAASFIYQLSKTTISNTGADTVTLTVTALDAKNNPVAGVPVSVSLDSGVYTPASTTTDASGNVTGTISIGGNKSNRAITATMQVSGRTSTASVSVVGSVVTLTPLNATPSPGQPVTVNLVARDAASVGIPGVAIQLGGTLGFNQTVTTDNGGNASATLAAAPAAGSYTVTANGSGVQTLRAVQVIATGGTGVPDAVGPISAANLSLAPNTIAPNVSGAVSSRATLRAVFQNAANQAVPNVRTRFEILPPGLGSGETISTGSATLYSDAAGVATADYIAGTRSSPTNGVRVRACYALTDAALANGACPNEVSATMTVASQPLAITLGDNNLLEKGGGELTYIKKFDVAVADAAGNAVPNAVISASVDIDEYGKGTFTGTGIWCANEDANRNGFLDTEDSTRNGVLDAGEDTNGNGTLDREDVNGSGRLEPRKADVILSYAGTNVTGANGRMMIQVEYPQNVATWLRYTVRVTTSVAGSEGAFAKQYITSFIKGDEANGSFLTAPYGSALSCTAPN